ncbi:aminoacetone oxidase family FAD-binding enzyme, partial [Mesorhizobium sp. M2D.F.Ca.ET.160.01.1.1]
RIAMLPGTDVAELVRVAKRGNGRQAVQTVLANHLPKRLAQAIAERTGLDGNLADLSEAQIKTIEAAVNDWRIKPAGSEGYRTAEVTLGGVDTNGLDQKTMRVKS